MNRQVLEKILRKTLPASYLDKELTPAEAEQFKSELLEKIKSDPRFLKKIKQMKERGNQHE